MKYEHGSKIPVRNMAESNDAEEMLEEHDFSGGVRGKYARRFAEGTNIVVLDSDVAALFPDSKAVNEALRLLARLAREQASAPAR